jgi:hypothetical protein
MLCCVLLCMRIVNNQVRIGGCVVQHMWRKAGHAVLCAAMHG